MRKQSKTDINIKRFYEFIKESQDSINEYYLDKRFPWTEEIGNLIDDIQEKVAFIKDNYNYGLSRRSHGFNGFEFDIKIRRWPDIEELSKKYKISESELNDYWDLFISDNLQMSGEDIIEGSNYFDDWAQGGRSGGWLILKHSSNVIENTEELISEKVDSLNDLSNGIEDEDVEEWKRFEEESGAGLRLLQRLEMDDNFEDIKGVKKESNIVKEELLEIIKDLDNLESELIGVDERISNFRKNSDQWFIDHIENVIKMEGEN